MGRAINDIQQMHGQFKLATNTSNTMAVLSGMAPVATMRDYAITVRNYSHGQGQLDCIVGGYRPCHNAETVIKDHHYEATADLLNTPDSVFCAHGAGYPVKWNQVPQMAHFPYQK